MRASLAAPAHPAARLQIFNSGGRLTYTLNIGGSAKLPTTCVRFRPETGTKTKGVVLVASEPLPRS
jgi:hypothetical protein